MGGYDLWIVSGLIFILVQLVSSYNQSPYSLCFGSDNCYLVSSRPLVWASSYYDDNSENEPPAPIFRDQDEEDIDIARILDWKVGFKVATPWKATLAQPNPWPGGWSKGDDDDEEEDEEDEEEDDKSATNSTLPTTVAATNATAVNQANATKVADDSDESDELGDSSEEEEFERWLLEKSRSGMNKRQYVQNYWNSNEDQSYSNNDQSYHEEVTTEDQRPNNNPPGKNDNFPAEKQRDEDQADYSETSENYTSEDQSQEQTEPEYSDNAAAEDEGEEQTGHETMENDTAEDQSDEQSHPEETADGFTREHQNDKQTADPPAMPENPDIKKEEEDLASSPELMDYLNVDDERDEQAAPGMQQQAISESESLSPEERLLLLKKKILLKKAIVGKAVMWKKKKILAKKAALLAKKKAIIRTKKKYLKKKFWKKKKKFLKKKRVWTKKKIIKAAVASQLFNKKGNKKGKPEGIPTKKKNRDPPSSASNPTPNSAEGGIENEDDNNKLAEDSLESGMSSAETVSDSPPITLFAATEADESSANAPESSGEVSPIDEEKPAKGKGKGKKKGLKKYAPRPVNLGLKADLLNRFNQVTSGVTQLFSAFRSDSYEDLYEGNDNTLAFPIGHTEFPYYYYYPVNKEVVWKRFYPVTLKVVYQDRSTT